MESQAPAMSNKREHIAEEVETSGTDHVSATNFDDLDLSNTLASKPDDSDGQTDWSFRKLLAALSLAGFYVAGATPTLLIGGSLKYIAEDLDAEFASWLITANTLVVASSTLFVGYLTDLFGEMQALRLIVRCFTLTSNQAPAISCSLDPSSLWLGLRLLALLIHLDKLLPVWPSTGLGAASVRSMLSLGR